MNCVIIISNVFKDTGRDPIFSSNDRINMLSSGIDAIRKNIPDSYIIIYECIKTSIRLVKSVLDDNNLVNNYYETNRYITKEYIIKIKQKANNLEITYSESINTSLSNLYKYLSSEDFITNLPKIKTLTIISEGLFLTENFRFDEWPLSSNVIQYKNDTFNPIFYRFPIVYLSTFYKKLQVAMKDEGAIGDLFLKHEVFTLENTIHDIPKLNLSGWNDTTGAYFEV